MGGETRCDDTYPSLCLRHPYKLPSAPSVVVLSLPPRRRTSTSVIHGFSLACIDSSSASAPNASSASTTHSSNRLSSATKLAHLARALHDFHRCGLRLRLPRLVRCVGLHRSRTYSKCLRLLRLVPRISTWSTAAGVRSLFLGGSLSVSLCLRRSFVSPHTVTWGEKPYTLMCTNISVTASGSQQHRQAQSKTVTKVTLRALSPHIPMKIHEERIFQIVFITKIDKMSIDHSFGNRFPILL